MRYFFCAFRLALVRRLRSRGGKAAIVLALLLSAALLCLPSTAASAAVQVGLVLPRRGGEELEALLQARSSQLVRFITTDEKTLDRNILTGQWDCGLVVPEDFEERLRELDTRNLVILKTAPGSTVYPLVRETAAACLMELLSPHIAREYLQDIGVADDSLDALLDELSQTASQVQIQLKTLDGKAMDPLTLTDSGIRRLLLGIVGVLTLIWGLYLAMDLGSWLSSPALVRLRTVRQDTALLLPQLLASMLPLLAWGMILLPWLSGETHTALSFGVFWLTMLGISLVCSRIPPLRRAMPVLMPFLVVGCLIFEPVLIDTAALFPALSPWTSWLPLGLFLRASDGSEGALVLLLGESACLLLISLLLDWIRDR